MKIVLVNEIIENINSIKIRAQDKKILVLLQKHCPIVVTGTLIAYKTNGLEIKSNIEGTLIFNEDILRVIK